MSNVPLSGQVALVTGGGRGIGAVVSASLARAGAKVAILGRNKSVLQKTAAGIHPSAIAVQADVTDAAALTSALSEVEDRLGPVDLLVNNAGIAGTAGKIAEIDAKDWWRTQEVNLLGVLLSTKAVLPGMLARGRGRIVHMGSYAGNTPGPGVSDYSVSKAALMRLNESLAAELKDTGILSIAVSPGVVETDMVSHFNDVFSSRDENWAGFPRDMVFPPEAVADLIVRIGAGEADDLGGRFIHVKEGLDKVLANLNRVIDEDLLLLRLRLFD